MPNGFCLFARIVKKKPVRLSGKTLDGIQLEKFAKNHGCSAGKFVINVHKWMALCYNKTTKKQVAADAVTA